MNEEEDIKDGLLDPAWEKQQKKVLFYYDSVLYVYNYMQCFLTPKEMCFLYKDSFVDKKTFIVINLNVEIFKCFSLFTYCCCH